MNQVDQYITTLKPPIQALFKEMQSVVQVLVPDLTQDISYNLPAFFYRQKPLISFVENKKFLSLYPFSGKVIAKLESKLTDFKTTTGSIHFSVEQPIPEALLQEIIQARMAEIDSV